MVFDVLLLAKLYKSRLHFPDGFGAGREEVVWYFGTEIFIDFLLVVQSQGYKVRGRLGSRDPWSCL